MLRVEPLEIKLHVTRALEHMGRAGVDVLPDLILLLRSKEPWEIRSWAARVLGQIGPQAAPAAEALADVLRREWVDWYDHSVVWPKRDGSLSLALHRIGPASVPWVVPLLSDENGYTRANALEILRRIGPPAEVAIPQILALLDSERYEAAEALGAIKVARPEVIEALRKRLDAGGGLEDPAVRRALERLGWTEPSDGD
jgi:HEAT repeat protein